MTFSIVTVNYNMAPFLERAMRSVLEQSGVETEYIVIDGGSTDGSVDIIKNYADRLAYWVSEPDGGQSDALNKGLARCTGDIVAWLNADDYYEPGALLKVAEVFKNNEDIGVVLGGCRMFDVSGKENVIHARDVSSHSLCRYWKSYFVPPQPSIFWRKEAMQKVGLMDTRLNYAMDLDFWLRMSKNERFYCMEDVLSHYEIHHQSKSGSGDGFDKFEQEWKSVCVRFVKQQRFGFRIRFYMERLMFGLFSKLQKSLRILGLFFKKALGVLVRLFKKVTGIKRLGILSSFRS